MIQTARCTLTPLQPDDLESVVKLYTNPDVRRFLGGPITEEAIRTKFSQLIAVNEKTVHWAIRIKVDNAFLGIVSLGTHHDGMDTEVSYQLLPEWWHQGYAKECVHAVVRYALETLELPRVIAETQTTNVASCRLLERLGMRLDRTVDRFGAVQSIYTTDNTPKSCHSG